MKCSVYPQVLAASLRTTLPSPNRKHVWKVGLYVKKEEMPRTSVLSVVIRGEVK